MREEYTKPLTPREKIGVLAFLVSLGAIMGAVGLFSTLLDKKDKER